MSLNKELFKLIILSLGFFSMQGCVAGKNTNGNTAGNSLIEFHENTVETLFNKHCSSCHNIGKGGNTVLESYWKYGGGYEDIKSSIVGGRKNVGSPSYKNQVSEMELDQLVSYVLSLSDSNVDSDSVEPGKKLFEDKACTACHREDGKGHRALAVPDITNQLWQYGGTRDAISKSISLGRKSVMPAFGEILDADSISSLVSYIESNGISFKTEENQIIRVFTNYLQGMQAKDPSAFYAEIDQQSKDLFNGLLEDALNLENRKLMKSKVPVERFNILYSRHKFSREELLKMTGYELFADLVFNSPVLRTDYFKTNMDNIRVTLWARDRADVVFRNSIREGLTPLKFRKEASSGKWKFELWLNRESDLRVYFRSISGQGERKTLVSLLESLTGRKPTEQLLEMYD